MRNKLYNYFIWLITPQDNEEKEKFKDVVDDYIQLKSIADNASVDELRIMINEQLSPYNLELG